MNAENFRHAYDYHYTVNRRIWDKSIMSLTDEQFLHDLPYSIGSIRNQVVHMMSIEQRWFSGLRSVDLPDFLNPEDFPDRESVRSMWDKVEMEIRAYLGGLSDTNLQEAFDEHIIKWQILFHVLNHATDHRAQILAMLNTLGAPTFPQDYIYFVWGVDPSILREG